MPGSLSYSQALAWTLGVTVALLSGAQVLAHAVPRIGSDIAVLGALEVGVYAAACLVLFRGQHDWVEALGFRRASPMLVTVAALLGVVLQVPASTLSAWVQRVSPSAPDELARRTAQLAAQGPGRALVLALVVAGAGPCVEELFFRGVLFSRLKVARGALGAAVAVAACFMLAHFDPKLWLPLAFVAAVLSYLRVRSLSLWPGLALHVAFNLTTLVALSLRPTPASLDPELPGWFVFAGWFAVAILLGLSEALLRKSVHPPNAPREAGI